MVNAEQLIKLLEFNLSNKNFHNAVKLLDDEEYSKVILSHYPEVIQEVILKHLTAENYANEPMLYEACEGILKLLTEKCHQEGILFEFIEIIETVKNDDIFTSILKCLQVIVLKQSEKKSRALEYCLNSIEDYVQELPLPTELLKNVEEEEEKVLENDEKIRRVLMMYMTLELFYDPIVKQIVDDTGRDQVFRANNFNRRNVLFCFILRMLGKPLSVLALSHEDEGKVKTYSRQVAENMVTSLCKLHTNVFRLLEYVENRCRWPGKEKIDDDLVDIFLHPEKAPVVEIGMLFYLILAENIGLDLIPRIYSPIYIFEAVIYLVNAMISSNEAVVYKGLKLCLKTLENITESLLSSDQLDLDIHREFSGNIIKLLLYSPSKRNRQTGLSVLRGYILKFDIEGRYLLIKNISRISEHKGLLGQLTTLYKNIVFEEIDAKTVSNFTSGVNFKTLVLGHFCSLNGGAQCDIADSSDQINASLNFLIGMLQKDKENLTGIHDFVPEIEKGFLSELRAALDLSRAHYHAEIENVKSGKSMELSEMLKNTEILNFDEPLTDLTSQKKLEMLYFALSMFDLMDYSLARVNEIINRSM